MEARLMQIVQGDLSQSAAKLVLGAARLAEKMAWLAPVVRKSDWYLVMSIDQRRCKEQRAEAKEWAQLEDLCRLCAAASSFAEWEAVALACISVGHCLRGSEAGVGVGQEDEGLRFFGTKSKRGVQRQEVGPWVRASLQFLAKLRALKDFHPDRGAWHESRELYIVIKVASYRGFERIRVGSDSNVARSQINALRALVHADSQQRILRW